MAETLGSLCDKLTIVKLKQYHTTIEAMQESLRRQEASLCEEIDAFVTDAVAGIISPDKLTFSANKVYQKKGNEFERVSGDIGSVFASLAAVNCELWHEQEKVYEFKNVPVEEKDEVVRKLAILNLKRNQCIDAIDKKLQEQILSSS